MQSISITFEQASTDNLPLLLAFVRQLRADDPDEGEFDEPATRAALPPLIEDQNLGRIWLIHYDNQAVGYVALTFAWSIEFGGRIAFVDELFVLQAHRGKGIGSAALEFVAAQVEPLQIRALLLEVTQCNAGARRLYTRQGFVDRPNDLMVRRFPFAPGEDFPL